MNIKKKWMKYLINQNKGDFGDNMERKRGRLVFEFFIMEIIFLSLIMK